MSSSPPPQIDPPSGGRKALFYVLMPLVTLAVAALAGEASVRLLVSEETFWPISNIYQKSTFEGVGYTFRADFEGIAFGVPLRTNSHGYRGPQWRREKPPENFRIALIGDSHAFGYGVPFESTMGEVLARLLTERLERPVEVLNFSVNGYNSRQQQAVVDQMVLPFDPDLVVLVPVSNDHEPTLRVDDDGWLHWDGDEQNWGSRMIDTSIDQTAAVDDGSSVGWMAKSRLWLYLTLVRKRHELQARAQVRRDRSAEPIEGWMAPLPDQGPQTAPALAAVVQGPIEAVIQQLKARRIPMVIGLISGRPDYRFLFRRLDRKFNVPVIELLGLFPEVESWNELAAEFGLGWDDHLNAVAHRRFAEAVAGTIESRGYGDVDTR